MYGLLFRGVATLAVALAVIVTPTYAMSPAPPLPTLPVQIRDECNPATFNAAVGPGTCVGSGAVTFQQFVGELQQFQFAQQWQFVPPQLHMRVNQSFTATNTGGELHSFTEVAAFGAGVIPFVNDLSGHGGETPRPECLAAFIAFQNKVPNSSFLLPGQSFTDTETVDNLGAPVLYQCCIHPWMNETITVRP